MKSEKELINQIRTLKQIKPDSEWVALTKSRIMGHEVMGQRQSLIGLILGFTYQYKIAFAGLMLACVTGGTLAISQGSLPGDALYGVKLATDKGYALVTGQNNTPMANLNLAAKRLEEINIASQRNLAKDLAAAFYDYKSAKVAAKKEVADLVKQNPSKANEIVKQAGTAMKDIDSKEKAVYGVLGLEQAATSTDDGIEAASDKTIVESLINYFKENATLSQDQENDLAQVKSLYEVGNYGIAVDYYLNSSLNK